MDPALAGLQLPEPWAFLVCALLPLATAGLSAYRHALRARVQRTRADQTLRYTMEETATLDPGDRVLFGRVAFARDQTTAVRTTVDQEGSEAESSGSWTVTWQETRRKTEMVPFYVVHASGARVRVEPKGRVKLEADLAAIVPVDRTHRTRVAQLLPDQPVWVMGVLGREPDPEAASGYRDAMGWVMRPAPGETMVVTCFAPERRLRDAATHGRVFARMMQVLLVAMLLLHVPYFALLATGRAATAKVVARDFDEDGFVVNVEVTDGRRTFGDKWDVDGATYNAAEPGKTRFDAYASFPLHTSDPGHTATANFVPTGVCLVIWAVLGLIAWGTANPHQWYDGKAVRDLYSGRLGG